MKCPKCGKEIAEDSVYCAYGRYKIQKKTRSLLPWILTIVVVGLCVFEAKADETTTKAEAEEEFTYAAIVKEEAERAKAKSDLTILEMEDFINHANEALSKLRRILRDPWTHKDDRLRACDEYEILEYERDDMLFRLEAARKGITCILPTDTFGINMDVTQMKAFIKKADMEINKLLKVVDSPEISYENRQNVYNEIKQLKRFRNTIQMRLDEEER